MTLWNRCRIPAVAMLAAGMIVATPASAGLIQIEPPNRPAIHDGVGRALEGMMPLRVATPMGVAPLGVAQAVRCDGCTPVTMPIEAPRRSATLSVNVAILVLGSLWLTLMVRRIQMRLGSDDLNGGARPHAAGGH